MQHKKLFIGLGIAIAAVVIIEIVLYLLTGAFGRTALATLFRDDPELQKTKMECVLPSRGDILDCKDRVIATNETVWDVHLDCTVLDVPDEEWKCIAADLAEELEAILGKASAAVYFGRLTEGRREKKQYLTICEDVNDSLASALKKTSLLKMGQFDGGAIFSPKEVRLYPYMQLGRRTVGYKNDDHAIGLEGAYDKVLSGESGKVEYVRKCRKGKYYWKEKSRTDAVNGQDITTSMDMDFMAIVDSELRNALEGRQEDVQSASAILMEVKNGAVRAMSNLSSGYEGESYDEVYNLAIGNEYEPGTVLTTMSDEVLEIGLKDAKFDIEGLRDAKMKVEDNGVVNVSCTPLHVLRIFGGIANGGVMFDPYLVMPSESTVLCSAQTADSLKIALGADCVSTAIVPHPSINGSDPYRYPSGQREFATTWCGFFNADGVDYALMVVAFSKKTMANAPQSDIPEKVAKGIIKSISKFYEL